MKKIVLSLMCLILLCGCGKKQSVDVTLESVSFDAAITYGSYNCTCNITISGGGMLASTILSPESIAGTTLSYDGENLTVNYMGLEYMPEMPISGDAANDIINKILQSASSGAKSAERVDDSFVLEGEVSGYEYSLFVTEAGLPLSLLCVEADLVAEFTNVTIK